jgi:hypothetical protein
MSFEDLFLGSVWFDIRHFAHLFLNNHFGEGGQLAIDRIRDIRKQYDHSNIVEKILDSR